MKLDGIASALIMIDVQNDFCSAGALAVAEGEDVVEPLNRLADRFSQTGGRVIATADWHPPDHVSFAVSHPGMKPGDTLDLPAVKGQVLWPVHCVQGSPGAEFHPRLNRNQIHCILHKGFRRNLDSYSAFFENDRQTATGLGGFLKSLGITDVFIGGLATDYCVQYSALDAVRLGYRTSVLLDAVRGVGIPAGSVETALEAMRNAGVSLIRTGDIL
ncbi:MAG: bifunctional nicotinamidase/pyrazinamidase [Spirochaetaceae bacterium]|jgi:nicotinamidase/pyrazinamidase|nr:bifunctional nicotinamidase/pyrazinamidase [Spirochaetaceae bacterium]